MSLKISRESPTRRPKRKARNLTKFKAMLLGDEPVPAPPPQPVPIRPRLVQFVYDGPDASFRWLDATALPPPQRRQRLAS